MDAVPATRISSAFSGGRAAVAAGALATGGAAAFGLMKASQDDKGPSRGMALTASLGLGSAALVAGSMMAHRGFNSITNAATGMGKIGAATAAAGVGSLLLGTIGSVANPVAGGGTPPTDPTNPTPPVGPAPPVSKSLDEMSTDPRTKSWTSAERALLAAVATQDKATAKDVIAAIDAIGKDEYLAHATTPSDRTLLTSAAMEAQLTTEDAILTMVNTDAYLWAEDASHPDGGDFAVKDQASRVKLAAAGLRGLATGEDVANKYLNISNELTDLSEAQNVELSAAALEGQVYSTDAVDMFNAVSADPTLRQLSAQARVDIAAGAMRGGQTVEHAVAAFSAIATDYPGQVLTPDDQARLAGTTLEAGVTGEDAVLTYVNLSSNENVYNTTTEQQKLELAQGALRGYRTGEDVAVAFNAIAVDPATRTVSVDDQVRLTAAAMQGNTVATDVVGAFAGMPSVGAKERVLMAGSQVGGLDTGTPSPLLEWYLAGDSELAPAVGSSIEPPVSENAVNDAGTMIDSA